MGGTAGLQVSDIMTRSVVSLSPGQTLREASIVLSQHRLSGAPVLDGGTLVGVLSSSDILDFIASGSAAPVREEAGSAAEVPENRPPGVIEGALKRGEVPSVADFYRLGAQEQSDLIATFDELAGLKLDLIDRHFVREAMTRNVIALPPDADVMKAASYLFWAGIHRVFVMDGDTLLGLVSTMDIVQAVAQRGLSDL